MKLTRQQEMEIYPLLDKVLDLPPGKAVLRECSQSRADYLARMIKGMIYDTAVESIEMYEKDHPLYGLGSYGKLWAEQHDQGVLVTKLRQPPLTLAWQLIGVAATRERAVLDETGIGRARQRLGRLQKKYPQIMNNVWISTDTDPPTAYYGELPAEQTLIVDIDLNPAHPLTPKPDDIQKAHMRPLRDPED